MKTLSIALVLVLSLVASCKKDDAKPTPSAPGAATAPVAASKSAEDTAVAPSAAPIAPENPGGATKEFGLEKLGLKVDAPTGARVVVAGSITKLIGKEFFATVWQTSKGDAQTLEDARKEATTSYGEASNFAEEKLADGWLLSFVVPGNDGPEHVVAARRDVNGKSISCNAVTRTQHKAAVATCKSLRP